MVGVCMSWGQQWGPGLNQVENGLNQVEENGSTTQGFAPPKSYPVARICIVIHKVQQR